MALAVIEDAERSGLLKPGNTVVEATTGNTGIAVAMMCAQRGYRCVITMPEQFSIERRKLMRFMGAKVVLTPKKEMGLGAVKKARELAEAHGWFLCRQFENEANSRFHEQTTGAEIIADFEGQQLDYLCMGWGTGGTYAGVSRAIKRKRPETRICLGEPEPAPLVNSGIQSERMPDGSAAGTHPAYQAHPIQGWTPDFIPKILEDALSERPFDEFILVPPMAAIKTSQALAQTQGIFTGIS